MNGTGHLVSLRNSLTCATVLLVNCLCLLLLLSGTDDLASGLTTTVFRGDSAKTFRGEHRDNHSALPRNCSDGPYVWVQGVHVEGIGASFRFNRRALLLSNFLNAKVVLQLRNHHTYSLGVVSTELGFSLEPTCTEAHLSEIQTRGERSLQLASRLFELHDFSEVSMCEGVRLNLAAVYLQKYKFTRETIIVVKQSDLHHGDDTRLEDCVYTEKIRENFWKRRQARGFIRPQHERWITAHFRWGDVGERLGHNLSEGSVDMRTGGNLNQFLETLSLAQKVLSVSSGNSTTKIHFLSEGREEDFLTVRRVLPNTVLHLDHERWLEALDIMSQSSILIGGRSSFFSLGYHLCDRCFVVSLPGKDVSIFPR